MGMGLSLTSQHSVFEYLCGTRLIGLWSIKSQGTGTRALWTAKYTRSRLDPPAPHPKAASANNADQCDHRASADAELVWNDLPRAPCPQVILKVWPPNSLDYRERYDTPAVIFEVFWIDMLKFFTSYFKSLYILWSSSRSTMWLNRWFNVG